MPSRDDTYWAVLVRKLKWMVITSLAPEVTTCLALGQFLEARDFIIKMRSIIRERRSRRLDMSLIGSFCVTMGGYEGLYSTLEGQERRLRLSPDVLYSLASEGYFIQPPKDREIIAKSRLDQLGVLLVVLQVGWLLLQTISRASQKLPISELEIATIAICFAAIVNYTIWWNKPKDPEGPIVVQLNLREVSLPVYNILRHSLETTRGRAMNVLAPMKILLSFRDLERGRGRGLGVGQGQEISQGQEQETGQGQEIEQDLHLTTLFGILALESLVFCGIHFSAWNWSFASLAEKWLWVRTLRANIFVF